VNSKPLVIADFADQASAIVECFNPGMHGGTALAELLFGKLNPSGKLTISIPRHVGQQPVFYSQMPMQHGDRYADLTQEPLFPFGFGLSYTRYEYSKLEILTPNLKQDQELKLEIEVKNVGARDGVEIVQVYVHDVVTSVTWPTKRLVAFQRVALAAGESKTLAFSLPFSALALIDAFEKSVVEPGEFELLVGGSSRDADLLKARLGVEGARFSFAKIPGVL
jgi:beta-glucosidase